MEVIDVSTPSQPKIIGSVETTNDVNGMTVVGDTVFVTDGDALQVIDVSTPSQPKIVGSIETPSEANGVAVIDDTAFVACNSADWGEWNGLQVIDVSTPSLLAPLKHREMLTD